MTAYLHKMVMSRLLMACICVAANSVVDKALSLNDAHKKNAYRPDVKTTTIKVSRHDSYKKVVAKGLPFHI